MSVAVEKTVRIGERSAILLEQLAAAHRLSEADLLAEAIELLYRMDSLDAASRGDMEALLAAGRDLAALPPYHAGSRVSLEEIATVVGTPFPPDSVLPRS